LRAPLAGISALLVVSLVMGAHLRAVRPLAAEPARDSLTQRAVLRHLASVPVKVIRQDAELERHKPVSLTANPAVPRPTFCPRGTAAVVQIGISAPPTLRAELLDLPPPTMSL